MLPDQEGDRPDRDTGLPRPTNTVEDLLFALEHTPPLMYRDRNTPFEDRRELADDPDVTNYFTPDNMDNWVSRFLDWSTRDELGVTETVTTESYEHLGRPIQAVTTTYKDNSNQVVAKYIEHDGDAGGSFVPIETFGLYGPDPDFPLNTFGIELTVYRQRIGEEDPDQFVYVYKTIVEIREEAIDEIISPVDVTDADLWRDFDNAEKTNGANTSAPQRRVVVSVGDPGLSERYQQDLIRLFRLPPLR